MLSASGTAAVVKLQPDIHGQIDVKDNEHKRESAKQEVHLINPIEYLSSNEHL